MNGEKIAKYVLMATAFSAVASLLLIAVFIFKEGLPFIFKVGLRDFLLPLTGTPRTGNSGSIP